MSRCHVIERLRDRRRDRCSSVVCGLKSGRLSDPPIATRRAARRRRRRRPAVRRPCASDRRDDRPGLAACLKALREGDTVVVWKLDRIGRNLHHLVTTVHDLTARGIGLKVLTGRIAAIDTTTPAGKLVFGIFAALAELERELISERTVAGLASARARGRRGGRPYKMTPGKLRLAAAAMGQPNTKVSDLCAELGIARQTLYRHVSPTGRAPPRWQKLLPGGRDTREQKPSGPKQKL